MRGAICGAALVASFLASGASSAGLTDEAARVADSWRKAGIEAQRKAPFFLEQGRVRRLQLSEAELSVAPDGCTSVTVMAPRGVEFVVRSVQTENPLMAPARPFHSERSAGGLLHLVRCGPERAELAAAVVEMRSARGAFEMLVGRSPGAAPPPTEALPERVVVASSPLVDPGRAPGREPVAAHLARVEARSRREGAVAVTTSQARSSDEGAGRAALGLREGCHRLEIVSDLGPGSRIADLDAELRDASTNALLARDRSDTPDARLEICVGDPTPAILLFGGAPPRSHVVVLDARFPLPARLPTTWGPRARGAMAMSLIRRRAPSFEQAPLVEALGVAGSTLVPVEIEPGGCYVATAAALRGDARLVTIGTEIEGRAARDDGGPAHDAATIAFCSRRTERATLRVEARGASIAWALALWRAGAAPRAEPSP